METVVSIRETTAWRRPRHAPYQRSQAGCGEFRTWRQVMTTFGERLRNLRLLRRWSQERLGFDLGVGKATISKWENGRAEPGFAQLLAIKRLFEAQGISLDYLLDEPVSLGSPSQDGQLLPVQINAEERVLLEHYRRLSLTHRRALLALLDG